jgi:hypothetical protein
MSKVSDEKVPDDKASDDNDKVCDDDALQFVQASFEDHHAVKVTSIQTLWNGYGEIARYFLPSIDNSVIVKIVMPQSQNNHPRGWDGQRSHQRKLDSYVNECIFYQHYSQPESCLRKLN